MKLPKVARVIKGRRYSTARAVVLAHDRYWDGRSFARRGRNVFLCRDAQGKYFALRLTQWQGECPTIEPLSEWDARNLYERLPEHEVPYKEAFPAVAAEEA